MYVRARRSEGKVAIVERERVQPSEKVLALESKLLNKKQEAEALWTKKKDELIKFEEFAVL